MLPIDKLVPNDWNPNVMEGGMFDKLKTGMKSLLANKQPIPPITVRPHPKDNGTYQIIDGYHRRKAGEELGLQEMPAAVLKVDDATAKILTATLNYLRGQPDEEKYSELLSGLVTNDAMSLEDLAAFLPEDVDHLQDILEISDAGVEALKLLDEEETEKTGGSKVLTEDNTFVDLHFSVSTSQARIIEKELNRLEDFLQGRNKRGRALEYMAVLSGQTPAESIEPSLAGHKSSSSRASRARRARALIEELKAETYDGD